MTLGTRGAKRPPEDPCGYRIGHPRFHRMRSPPTPLATDVQGIDGILPLDLQAHRLSLRIPGDQGHRTGGSARNRLGVSRARLVWLHQEAFEAIENSTSGEIYADACFIEPTQPTHVGGPETPSAKPASDSPVRASWRAQSRIRRFYAGLRMPRCRLPRGWEIAECRECMHPRVSGPKIASRPRCHTLFPVRTRPVPAPAGLGARRVPPVHAPAGLRPENRLPAPPPLPFPSPSSPR